MGTILLILLVLLLLGALPTYPYSRNWGYAPSGVATVLLVILLVLLFMNVLPWGFTTATPVVVTRP
jgi:Mg2+/Co2+ transporter CorB